MRVPLLHSQRPSASCRTQTTSWIGLVRSSELRLAKPPARDFFPREHVDRIRRKPLGIIDDAAIYAHPVRVERQDSVHCPCIVSAAQGANTGGGVKGRLILEHAMDADLALGWDDA